MYRDTQEIVVSSLTPTVIVLHVITVLPVCLRPSLSNARVCLELPVTGVNSTLLTTAWLPPAVTEVPAWTGPADTSVDVRSCGTAVTVRRSTTGSRAELDTR